jgi:DNA-binding Xre family transcriptional regulator
MERAFESALQFKAFARSRTGAWIIRFPTIPGLEAKAMREEAIQGAARAALEDRLHQDLQSGARPAWGGMHEPPLKDERTIFVDIPAPLAIAVQIRRARIDNGWSQGELARRAGMTQQQIARLEDPDGNPRADTLERISAAIGEPLVVVYSGAVR